MTEETTQAVVDPTQAVAEPTATEGSAPGNDLATFLTEYENGTKPQPQPVQTATTPDPTKEALAEIQSFRQERAQEKHSRDLAEAVKTVKGDLDLPEWAVQGWIDAKARDSKAIQKIWNEREQNPAALNKLLSGMKKEFASENAKSASRRADPDATADRAAVAAAVRGASTKAPDSAPPNLGKMSNAEYNAFLRENGMSGGAV